MVEGKPVDIVYVNKRGNVKLPDTIRRLINIEKHFAVYVETNRGKSRMIFDEII